MKMQTTKKAIMSTFNNVIRIGYCDMQSALKWREPNFYTAGVYGWNADVYVISDETVIVTGYRPFGNMEISRDVINILNICAESVTRYLKYDMAKTYLQNNLDELASGIEYDFNNYIFEGVTGKFEVGRK